MKSPSAIELEESARQRASRTDAARQRARVRRGDAPQRLVDADDQGARLGMDLSVADGPVARTAATPVLNLLTDPYRIKRHTFG
ncbi:hypothetical protein [Micromonospora sp. NPDC049274]|uniref:hypothetical protein n=1 Tax=Micromonospora sp. NPDC049274 TaxID=3154829 RepID=UPI0034471242